MAALALTIGELVGYISFDTSGVEDGLAQGESSMNKFKAAAAAIGAGAGAVFMASLNEAMEQEKVVDRLSAQLSATPEEAAKYGKIAGKLYADAVTDDIQGAADAIRATMSSGLLPTGATESQIQSIATQVSDLANTFELDLGQSANAVGQVMKNKLAPDAQTALDVITRGMQVMGPRADDLADTFNEYSPIFAKMGLSAAQATGLLSQGMKAGARDTDVVADAIKEFSIRAIDGSKASAEGFKSLGLDAKAMTAQIAQGGEGAASGMQLVLDKLRGIKDPVQQNAAAVALFGTKAEDMGNTLLSLDPSKAVAALGKVAGASKNVGDTLRDSAGVRLEQFKRKVQETFVHAVGAFALPKIQALIDKVKAFKNSPEFEVMKQAAINVGTALMNVGRAVMEVVSGLAPLGNMLLAIGGAAVEFISAMPPDTLMAIATAVGAIFLAVKTYQTYLLLVAAATKAWAIAQGILNAVMMLNPVGLVIAAIVALVAIIVIAWQKSETFRNIVMDVWEAIKTGVKAAIDFVIGIFKWWVDLHVKMAEWVWNAAKAAIQKFTDLVTWLAGLPSRVIGAIASLAVKLWNWATGAFKRAHDAAIMKIAEFIVWARGIPGRAISALASLGQKLWNWASAAFQRAKDAASSKASQLISFVKDLPRRIVSGIGNLGSLLYDKGKSVVQGLWNGIKSMGGWIAGKVSGWARSVLPGPIADALGIHSPSRVMAKEIGRWIPPGIIDGIESASPALDRAMSSLVTPASVQMGAGGVGGGAGVATVPVIRVVVDPAAASGDDLLKWLRKTIRVEAGGNVQLALGK